MNKGDKMNFDRKYYGRLFVDKEENIQRVKDIIKEMDDYEFEYYLPNNLITVFNVDNLKAVYTHKFTEIDTQELTKRCWLEGIHVFCWYGKIIGYEDY